MDGSGFLGHRPRWEWYELAIRHRRRIKRLGQVFGVNDIDSTSIAADVALALCFDARIGDLEQAEREFWRRMRPALRHYDYKARFREVPLTDLVPNTMDSDRMSTERILDRLSAGSTRANQIDYTYLCQIFREIDLLPSRHREILKAKIEGETPIEIAERMGIGVESVLTDLGVARSWLTSANDPTG